MTTEDFGGLVRVTVAVENTTEVADDLTRTEALASSLLSTHVVVRCGTGGRFMSPISPPEDAATAVMTCANVNTFPVLATAADDAVLGAAIMLPDHPEDRAREPREPVRLDRDRGGAAAPRPGAERR